MAAEEHPTPTPRPGTLLRGSRRYRPGSPRCCHVPREAAGETGRCRGKGRRCQPDLGKQGLVGTWNRHCFTALSCSGHGHMSPVCHLWVLNRHLAEGCRILGFSGGFLLLGGHGQPCQGLQCTMALIPGAWGQGWVCGEPVPCQVSCPQGVGHSSCPAAGQSLLCWWAEHAVGWDRAIAGPLLQPCPCCDALSRCHPSRHQVPKTGLCGAPTSSHKQFHAETRPSWEPRGCRGRGRAHGAGAAWGQAQGRGCPKTQLNPPGIELRFPQHFAKGKAASFWPLQQKTAFLSRSEELGLHGPARPCSQRCPPLPTQPGARRAGTRGCTLGTRETSRRALAGDRTLPGPGSAVPVVGDRRWRVLNRLGTQWGSTLLHVPILPAPCNWSLHPGPCWAHSSKSVVCPVKRLSDLPGDGGEGRGSAGIFFGEAGRSSPPLTSSSPGRGALCSSVPQFPH